MNQTVSTLPKTITKYELCQRLGMVRYGSGLPRYQQLRRVLLTDDFCNTHGIRLGKHKEFNILETEKIFQYLERAGYNLKKLFNHE